MMRNVLSGLAIAVFCLLVGFGLGRDMHRVKPVPTDPKFVTAKVINVTVLDDGDTSTLITVGGWAHHHPGRLGEYGDLVTFEAKECDPHR